MPTYTVDNIQGVNVKTTVVNQSSSVNHYISEFKLLCVVNKNRKSVVGLDVEWIPNSTYKKVATLQLSAGTRCLIIQLQYLDFVPESLKNFIPDNDICFVGVGINEDVGKIKKDYGIECKTGLELGPLAARVLGKPHFAQYGLADLAREVVELNVEKPTSVTCCNWGATTLTAEQLSRSNMLPLMPILRSLLEISCLVGILDSSCS